jgi:hypothetical protein
LIEARKNKEEPPRGIPITSSGDWAVPITVGVDQDSEAMAVALGIDHNSLTYTGGSGGLSGLMAMWDQDALVGLLSGVADEEIMPVTIDEDALSSLLLALNPPDKMEEGAVDRDYDDDEGMKDDLPDSPVRMVQLFLNKDTHPRFMDAVAALSSTGDYADLTECVYEVVCGAAGVDP